jgi:hypothetical protein
MTEQTTDIINYNDKEVERLQKEQEDKIYRTHALSIKDFLERKKKWDEVQSIYGSDPYFYQLFGFLDPMLALSFVKEEDITKTDCWEFEMFRHKRVIGRLITFKIISTFENRNISLFSFERQNQ